MTLTTANVTASINSGGSAVLGYNTTSGGSKFVEFTPPFAQGTSSVTFTFDKSISAWGAWFTGVGTVPDTAVSVAFTDGTAQSYSPLGSSSGGVSFFGFTDPGKSIASVTVQEVLTGLARDIFGIDDVQFVYSAAALLSDLANAVKGVGPGTSLADKVASVQSDLALEDTSDACGTLNAFIHEVKAQSGKSIPAGTASSLIAAAQQIEAAIGCT